jgi:hypothetical protein
MARLDSDKTKLTPAQQLLWQALADGEPHPAKELRHLLDCDANTLAFHASNLRTKIRQSGCGETIINEGGSYRRVAYVNRIGSNKSVISPSASIENPQEKD